jgi:hypothetical protein
MKNNVPAFPQGCPCQTVEETQGMTLRDYFAGQAIAGMAKEASEDKIAAWAYSLADAMLAEKLKKPHDE